MKNIFNKTNAPYLAVGVLATLTLLASGVFAVAPYAQFLAPVAALSVGLPFIISGAVFSAVAIALSSVVISKNNTISEKDAVVHAQEQRISEKNTELFDKQKQLSKEEVDLDYLDLAVSSSEQKQRANSLDYLNIDNDVPKQPDHLSIDAAKRYLMSLSEDQDVFYDAESGDEKDPEISSPENQKAKEDNGQGWSAYCPDKAKTAAKVVFGGALCAASAAPILVDTLFTGSSASPAGDMFNSIKCVQRR